MNNLGKWKEETEIAAVPLKKGGDLNKYWPDFSAVKFQRAFCIGTMWKGGTKKNAAAVLFPSYGKTVA